MKNLMLAFLLLGLAACTTTPEKEERPFPTAPMTTTGGETSKSGEGAENNVDLVALQAALEMNRDTHDLGYREKSFNTCDVGYGFSRSQNCRRSYFIVVNFQLQCRDSEGTISTTLTESDVQPIANRQIDWKMRNKHGTIYTDSLGYGQVVTYLAQSAKKERLKLATGPEFLYMRAGELTRVVTPQPWCPVP